MSDLTGSVASLSLRDARKTHGDVRKKLSITDCTSKSDEVRFFIGGGGWPAVVKLERKLLISRYFNFFSFADVHGVQDRAR